MTRQNLTLLLLLFMGLLILACENTNEPSGVEYPAITFTQSECLPIDNETAKRSVSDEPQDSRSLVVWMQGDTLVVKLQTLYWNCCPEFEVVSAIDLQQPPRINLVLKDNAEDHCRCVCHFDVTTYMTAVPPGEYQIFYVIDYEWQGSDVGVYDTLIATITVPGQRNPKSDPDIWTECSDCYDPSDVNAVEEDSLRIEVNGDRASIYHYATYNCAAIINTTRELKMYKLVLVEEETNNIANCICPFELRYDAGPLDPADYWVEIWSSEDMLLAKGQFTIE